MEMQQSSQLQSIQTAQESLDLRMVEIRNIAPQVSLEDINRLVIFCGTVVDCEMIVDTTPGQLYEQSKIARVTFSTPVAAETAEILNGTVLAGRSLRIQRLSQVPTEPTSEPQSSDNEWNIVRGLGELTGKGFVIGQKAIDYLAEFDARNNITKTIGAKAQELDDRTQFTASLNSIINSARERWREFELNHPSVLRAEEKISNTLNAAGERVNATAEKLRQYPIVNRGLDSAGTFTSVAQSTIDAGLGTTVEERTTAISDNNNVVKPQLAPSAPNRYAEAFGPTSYQTSGGL